MNEQILTQKRPMELPKDILDWVNKHNQNEITLYLLTVLSDKMRYVGVNGLRNYIQVLEQDIKINEFKTSKELV